MKYTKLIIGIFLFLLPLIAGFISVCIRHPELMGFFATVLLSGSSMFFGLRTILIWSEEQRINKDE